MTNRITGVTGPVVAPAERSTAKGRDARVGGTQARDTGEVKLTSAAQEVRSATEALASVPVVDQVRVDAVRSALQRGDYQPDPARIAGALLDMEDQI